MKKVYYLFIALIGAVVFAIQFNFSKTESTEDLFSHQLELQEKYGHLSYDEMMQLPKQDRPDLAALQHFEMTKDVSLGYPPIERKLEAYEKLK